MLRTSDSRSITQLRLGLVIAAALFSGCRASNATDHHRGVQLIGLAVVGQRTELALIDVAEAKKTALTNSRIISPLSFSLDPRTSRVVFSAPAGAGHELFMLTLETGEETALTNRGTSYLNPQWSPDGSLIAAEAVDVNGRRSVQILDAAGRHVSFLPESNWEARYPSWSADGTMIAVVLLDDMEPSPGHATAIGVVDLETGDVNRYDIGLLEPYLASAAWSPQGMYLAFPVKRDHSVDVYLHDSRTGEVRPAAATSADEWMPVWYPSGSRVAYLSSTGEAEGPSAIRVLDLPTGQDALAYETGAAITSISWLGHDGLMVAEYDSLDDLTTIRELHLSGRGEAEVGHWPGMLLDLTLVGAETMAE